MAIVRCPSCSHRISSLAETCPECGYNMKTATVDAQTQQVRRLRKLRYQARMLTYVAMLVTMIGFFMWWLQSVSYTHLTLPTILLV